MEPLSFEFSGLKAIIYLDGLKSAIYLSHFLYTNAVIQYIQLQICSLKQIIIEIDYWKVY